MCKHSVLLGAMLLSERDYSEENLDYIFRWYAKRHAKLEKEIAAVVYTEEEIRKNGNFEETLGDLVTFSDAECKYCGTVTADAGFQRFLVNDDENAQVYQEYYWYRPYPGDFRHQNGKLLKGTPGGPRKIHETWMASSGSFDVRVTVYELEYRNTEEPVIIYYTFEVRSIKEMIWHTSFTTQAEHDRILYRNQVKIIDRDTGFIFSDGIFVMTGDGGESWHKWDADKELPDWECCETNIIQNVSVNSDGTGRMILKTGQHQLRNLSTRNYGKSWVFN